MLMTVAGDTQAIGYVSLGSLNETVKAVKIEGVEATAQNVADGSYKIARPPSRIRCPQSSGKCRRYPRRASTACRKGISARRFPPSRAGRWPAETRRSAPRTARIRTPPPERHIPSRAPAAPVFCSFAPYHHPQKNSTAAPSPSGNRLGSGRMFLYFTISFHFVASPRKMEAICSTVISSVGFSGLTITAMPSIAMA